MEEADKTVPAGIVPVETTEGAIVREEATIIIVPTTATAPEAETGIAPAETATVPVAMAATTDGSLITVEATAIIVPTTATGPAVRHRPHRHRRVPTVRCISEEGHTTIMCLSSAITAALFPLPHGGLRYTDLPSGQSSE